jgi:hypothetical protein
MYMKKPILVFSLGLTLLCSTYQELPAMDAMADVAANGETVAQELALAEAARLRAAATGAEWLQTGSLIDQAKQAVEDEEWQLALALARKAKQQGELAIEQAERESVAWRSRVIR